MHLQKPSLPYRQHVHARRRAKQLSPLDYFPLLLATPLRDKFILLFVPANCIGAVRDHIHRVGKSKMERNSEAQGLGR